MASSPWWPHPTWSTSSWPTTSATTQKSSKEESLHVQATGTGITFGHFAGMLISSFRRLSLCAISKLMCIWCWAKKHCLEYKRWIVSIPLCNPHRRRSAATGEFESGEGSVGMLTIAHYVLAWALWKIIRTDAASRVSHSTFGHFMPNWDDFWT